MDDTTLIFQPEETPDHGSSTCKHVWKVLIVDDEPEVHTTTRLVLSDFEFEGTCLEFVSAYSGKEAVEIMKTQEDIAVILLDVVMETTHAGLDCARIIREEINNNLVRIVLRTGQPGHAPENKVIVDYDINDYKQKTDLTSQRLFTTVYTAIRSYRDMAAIEKNRVGLKYIIEASGDLFKQQSIKKLAKGVLTQISALFKLQDSLFFQAEGFTMAKGPEGQCEYIAATGKYANHYQYNECAEMEQDMNTLVQQVTEQQKSAYFGDNFVGYLPTQKKKHHIIYLENCGRERGEEYQEILEIFTHNVGVAFDNVYLNKEIQETQQEIIHLLGEIVESRSKETAFHVIRVAEYVGIIGEAAGYPADQVSLIKAASPMHDVGKVAIPDAILLKPDRLSPEETEVMKTHTRIGHKILSSSKREILQMAATIAMNHHERWDGTGYPEGLKGEDIPLGGRLTCLADVFDALATQRIYKNAWPMDQVFEYITEHKGRLFDPGLVNAFMDARDQILAVNEQYADPMEPELSAPTEVPER